MFKYCLRLQGGGKGLKVSERACKKGTAHTHTHTHLKTILGKSEMVEQKKILKM